MKTRSVVILIFTILLATVVRGADPGRDDQRRAKARYYYMEASRRSSLGDNAEAYELYRKAYQSDPTYAEAANAYGSKRLLLNVDTLRSMTEIDKSMRLMQDYVDEYPGDIFESTLYAVVAGRLDTIEESVRVLRRSVDLNPGKTALLVHLADAYMAMGEVDSAVNTLSTYERIEGKSPQLTLKKINFLMARNDTAGAIREVTSLSDAYPKEADYVMLKGNLFEALQMADSTLYYYRKAESMEPGNGAVKMALAGYYQQDGDSLAYDRSIYEALLAEDFGVEDKCQVLAEYLQTLLTDQSDTKRGDTLFEALRRQYPHEPMVLDLAARYSGAKGDYAEAKENISYAIDLQPDEEKFYGQLMSYCLAEDEAKEAMDVYHKALDHVSNPTDGLKFLYASACSLAGLPDEARAMYGDMIAEVSPSADSDSLITDRDLLRRLTYEQLTRISTLYNLAGDAYYTADEVEKAFTSYENSLFFMPDNAMTLNNYSYFLTQQDGDLERAEEMSRRAVAQAPDNDTYLDTYAWVEFKLGNYAEARDIQAKAMELAGERDMLSAELYEHYGDILFMNKEPEEALANWEKALELDPENALLKKKVEHRTYFYPEKKK